MQTDPLVTGLAAVAPEALIVIVVLVRANNVDGHNRLLCFISTNTLLKHFTALLKTRSLLTQVVCL